MSPTLGHYTVLDVSESQMDTTGGICQYERAYVKSASTYLAT